MIVDFLNKQINSAHNLPAIISDVTNLNYPEFNKRILNYANQLLKFKINKDDHIAVISDNNSDLIIILFALWEISAVPVVLNCKLTDEELERLIIHSGSKIIFTHSEFKNRMSGLNKITFPLPYDTLSKIDPGITDADRNKTTLILYTSGTTGSPKGVMLSFNNLISSVESAGTFFNFNQNDRWLVSLPVYHIGGIQILIRSVVYGSAMIIPNSLRINDIIHAIKKFSPTQISLVPTVLSRLIEKDILPNPELKNVFLGGGPVNDELVKLAVIKGWNIIKVYGSTETSSMVTSVSVKDKPDKISSAGKPLGSNIISVIDVDGNPLPEKEYGEIVVEGDSIMQGYWINEEGTKKQLLNRKFFTGDLGFLDEDGFLFVDSRKDDLIISGGENIYPAEIEEVILGLSDVQQVCVLGLEDREWGQIVAAAIVIKKSSVLTQEKIIELLKSRIASFKIPKKLIFVDEIPKTPLGKVKRESIRKLF